MPELAHAGAAHRTPEDWRILRALSFYRLLLVGLLLVLFETEFLAGFFDEFRPTWFYTSCVAYAVLALILHLPIVYRQPAVQWQANGQFTLDVLALTSLTYACGGVPSGLAVLVVTPAVGCSMVVSTRMAWVQAASATFAVFAEEFARQYPLHFDAPAVTQSGVLGLMFFATSIAANAVAVRARRSEALVARTGVDLANLARLNERVLEQMQTGVVVTEAVGRIRLMNATAARLLQTRRGASLALEAPGVALALAEWRQGRSGSGQPVAPRPNAPEVIPRFSALGSGDDSPVLILVDDAQSVRDQALQLKLAALGRLSASIAHEIRNPLSAISQAGQLLSESTGLDGENQRLLAMIQRHTDRIDKIVNDVMALSRRETPVPDNIALQKWLRQSVDLYREGHPHEDRDIQIQVADDVEVRFDANQLQQVLYNLWDNSFRYARRPDVPLQVAVQSGLGHEHRHYIDIADNGPGIPRELHDRMFEPFFTTGAGGTGLGLFLARELCEYNHARLSYRSRPEGACFRLEFSPTETA